LKSSESDGAGKVTVTSAFRSRDRRGDHGLQVIQCPLISAAKPKSAAKYSGACRRLLELLDNGGAESRKVSRRSAGDQISIHHNFFVDDCGAGIS
jgi:hypothetical protein